MLIVGFIPYHLISTSSTNATSVKTSSGKVSGIYVLNTANAIRFVKFFDKASAPTLGTDVPVFVLGIAANGIAQPTLANPILFNKGIAFAMVTGSADNDTGAVTAGDLIMSFVYSAER
jgi:hypothetical protein